ncbi:MAG: hypothetical protein SVR08_07085 [Spirochaetota bacterium]|nr:hypothetical protein [Spirochaetota bacterium]
MNKKSKFTQETLDKINKGEKSESTVKKRRLSRIVLFIDIIIIVLIVVFVTRKDDDIKYYSSSLSLNHLEYRFSIVREKESRNYLFSLSIKSNSTTESKFIYEKSIAQLTIHYNEDIIYSSTIGNNVTSIDLLPGELKRFVIDITADNFNNYAKEHTEHLIHEKRSLWESEKKYLPLSIIIKLNTREAVSTTLSFNHEVE